MRKHTSSDHKSLFDGKICSSCKQWFLLIELDEQDCYCHACLLIASSNDKKRVWAAYRLRNKDKISQRRRKYYEKHRQEYIHKARDYRARRRGAGGGYTLQQWKALCGFYGFRCLMCNEQKPLAADHVVPLCKGGTNNIENIQPLCRECNSRKYRNVLDLRSGNFAEALLLARKYIKHKQFTAEDVVQIREQYKAGGYSHSSLAKEYGVSASTITSILSHRTWAWIGDDTRTLPTLSKEEAHRIACIKGQKAALEACRCPMCRRGHAITKANPTCRYCNYCATGGTAKEMLTERCEWNPETNTAAYGLEGCVNESVLSVGCRRKNFHLCESCASLPNFKQYKKTKISKPLEAVQGQQGEDEGKR